MDYALIHDESPDEVFTIQYRMVVLSLTNSNVTHRAWSRKSMSKSIPPAWGTFPLGHSPWVCGKGGGGGGGITTVEVDDEASMPER